MKGSGKPPTEKQNAARKRAWLIFRLRGLYAQSHMLTGKRKEAALAAIDEELSALGAQTEAKRCDIRAAKWEDEK